MLPPTECPGLCRIAWNVDGGYTSFDVNSGGLTTYDAAGNQLAAVAGSAFDGGCGAADVTVDGVRKVITEHTEETPAQGIDPATYDVVMQAWDPETGASLWSTQVYKADPGETTGCDASRGWSGPVDYASITTDGKWAVTAFTPDSASVVNLTDGTIRPAGGSIGAFGPYVLLSGTDEDTARFGDPATLKPVGSATAAGTRFFSLEGFNSNGSLFDQNEHYGLADTGRAMFTVYEPDFDYVHHFVRATSVPGGQQAWQTPVPGGPTLIGEGSGVVVIDYEDEGGGSVTLLGIDAATGRTTWTTPHVQLGTGNQNSPLCGMTNTQLLISTTAGQIAVLDVKTGKQVSFEDNPYKDPAGNGSICPDVGPTGVGRDAANGMLIQLLTP